MRRAVCPDDRSGPEPAERPETGVRDASNRPICARPGCQEPVEAYREWQRFCSPRCRKRAWELQRARETEDRIVERLLPQLERHLRQLLREERGPSH